jgi:hypothetical protein
VRPSGDNALAGKTKSENDSEREYFSTKFFCDLSLVERLIRRQQIGIKRNIQMIDTSRRAATLWALTISAISVATMPAFSQAPTDAQRSAIRSECRADYEAHCASIPPGGVASLHCLQKNMSGLAPGCQSAVRAVEAPAEPKAEAKPESAPAAATAAPTAEPAAQPAPKAAASAPAKKPSSAQIAAIRSACRADYQKTCAGVPTGGAAALNCLETNKAKLSANCQQAVNAASGGGAMPAAGGTATATATPGAAPTTGPATIVLRPMRPREELFVLRSACGGDVRALCGGVPPGGGRIVQCLASQAVSLSPACKDVLAAFAAR